MSKKLMRVSAASLLLALVAGLVAFAVIFAFFGKRLLAALAVTLPITSGANGTGSAQTNPDGGTAEGPLQLVHITAGPFDLHRKYRSMEGPYVRETFRVADLIEAKEVVIPESHIHFVEKSDAPSMNSQIIGAAPAANRTVNKELYWLKGMQLQVLDENGKPLPTAEFICHMNLDVEPRGHVFEKVQGGNPRLLTLTQGQTDFHFPDGFAVPLSSAEKWRITMQAANRTTTAHRRIKHLLTMEFIKDSQLRKQIKALAWYTPYIAVIVDKKNAQEPQHHALDCGMTSSGATAPNMVAGAVQKDAHKRLLTGHWAVPPGIHTYTAPVTDERDRGIFSKDRIVHAVWTHIHPTCVKTSLVMCDGDNKSPVYSIYSQTNFDKGLELAHIDNFCSKDGLLVPANKHYEIEAVYDNATKVPQDAMVAQGIYFEDDQWIKPAWHLAATAASALAAAAIPGSAGVPPASSSASAGSTTASSANPASGTGAANTASRADYGGSDEYPLFNAKTDGPLLDNLKPITIKTSAGPLHLVLDPSSAPENASQMYRLFKAGAFDGTTIFRYQPGFLLEVAPVNVKHGAATLSNAAAAKLRRLPLEIVAQEDGKASHKKWALTMSHYKAPDSAVSSFGILLADAPHLDHQFTVFGYLIPDKETLATLNKIVSHWSSQPPPFIISAGEDPSHSKAALATAPTQAKKKHECNDLYCGIKSTPQDADSPDQDSPDPDSSRAGSRASSSAALNYPVFSTRDDGPLLSRSKNMIMKTSAGNIHLILEPRLAPKNASQMYRLFKAGAFDGTPMARYEPNFVLQTALVETKTNGAKSLSPASKALLRRLPLETTPQPDVSAEHKKLALSMAHGDDPNSAVSSFSILLADAAHLDHKFTVFGHALADKETTATLQNIAAHWSQIQPTILSVEESREIASNR